jgi:hypothetical protein
MVEPKRYRGPTLSWAAAILLAATTLVAFGSSDAHAQPAPAPATPPPANDAATVEARRHFSQAVALYTDGNYDAALAEFLAAYKTKPSAFILYNIGLTYKPLFLYNDAIRTLEQYLRDEQKLTPDRKAEVEQLLREMQALLAKVDMQITPPGATVKVDGRSIGHAPIGEYLLAAGRHVVDISAEGYTPQNRELLITAGQPTALTVALALIPKSGRAHIVVEPVGATVKVDGKIYPTPADLELPLGGHTFEAWATGYQVHREELLIAPGQTREIRLQLRRPPIYKRAALWVPVAIGIVGVAVGVAVPLALKYQNDIIQGTLAPGSQAVGK